MFGIGIWELLLVAAILAGPIPVIVLFSVMAWKALKK
jgi:hypothetical protein